MKIAYVTMDSGAPIAGKTGASIHICEIVNAFCALGHQVTVVATRRGDQSFSVGADTHDVEAAADADLVVVLEHGRIIGLGAPVDLIASGALASVPLSEIGGKAVPGSA